MEKALDVLAEKDIQKVMIHAQEYVKDLYYKLGFEEVGESFEEAGISHIKMIKKLNRGLGIGD
jgi:predicted GNAT family N-acyltransferase